MNQRASVIWQGIKKVWHHTKNGLGWSLGDGKSIRFWFDIWVGSDNCLADITIMNIPTDLLSITVQQAIDPYRNWDWSLFQAFLPISSLLQIAAIKPPLPIIGNDIPF